ncbi:hypothetical protein [Microcoleus sp. S13_B4]|uniref:hypothetical protein n=1 Tax=Microcoleus sp. S13_B4 TaxID=3055408 RepID=UPI002FD70DED
MPCFASSENCEKSGNIIYIRRKKEEGRRKREEGRRKKEEGRRKREEKKCNPGNNFSD